MPVESPKLVAADSRFKAKGPCPYCGGKITFCAGAWVQEDDGSWIATDLDMECSSEPPMKSKRWAWWSQQHGGADWGEAWHILHDALVAGLKRRFRFTMEGHNA